jgi:hypothetical protein
MVTSGLQLCVLYTKFHENQLISVYHTKNNEDSSRMLERNSALAYIKSINICFM